jgi:tetratricopeptide (TPR) repeat protein
LEEFARLLALAHVAHEERNFNKELEYLNDAINRTEKMADIVSIYEKLGTAHYLLGDREKATTNYLLALDGIHSLNDISFKELGCLIYYNLGSVFFDDDRYDMAIQYNLYALRCINVLEETVRVQILISTAICYEKSDQLDDAIEFYLKALESPAISGGNIPMVTSFVGRCYDKLGNHVAAFKYFSMTFEKDITYDGG